MACRRIAQYKLLHETRIRVDAELELAIQRRAEIETNAVRGFGTSDPRELKAILEKRKARNNLLREQSMDEVVRVNASVTLLRLARCATLRNDHSAAWTDM